MPQSCPFRAVNGMEKGWAADAGSAQPSLLLSRSDTRRSNGKRGASGRRSGELDTRRPGHTRRGSGVVGKTTDGKRMGREVLGRGKRG